MGVGSRAGASQRRGEAIADLDVPGHRDVHEVAALRHPHIEPVGGVVVGAGNRALGRRREHQRNEAGCPRENVSPPHPCIGRAYRQSRRGELASSTMTELGTTAIGTWSGGRYLHFGEAISDERLESLLRPGDGIETVLTADAYGQGEADSLLGRALGALHRARATASLAPSATTSGRGRARRPPGASPASPTRHCEGRANTPHTCGWRPSARSSGLVQTRSTCCCSTTPTAPASRTRRSGRGCGRCATTGSRRAQIGIAPGPANGFTLDLIRCFERFGEAIDWAMVILNPLEPWPGGSASRSPPSTTSRSSPGSSNTGACSGTTSSPDTVRTRGPPPFRPEGWVEAGPRSSNGCDRSPRRRPHPDAARLPVESRPPGGPLRVPTLIQEAGGRRAPDRGQARRAGGASASSVSTPRTSRRSARSATTPAACGSRARRRAEGLAPDRWPLSDELAAAGRALRASSPSATSWAMRRRARS